MIRSEFDITNTYFWKALRTLVKYAMILCSVSSTACIIIAVVLRYIFKSNFYGSDEIILMFAFWLYFTGAVYGSYENSHIKADLMNVYVKNIRIKDFINLVAQTAMIAVNVTFVTWAWNYFVWGLEKMPLSTGLKIPLVIPQSAVFFGLLLMLFYHIVYLIRNVFRYIHIGYYSAPQYGDYMTAAAKARFPQADIPMKEEIQALLESEDKVEGGRH